ncbi:hypothetical protein [Aeromicrobium alkaliterrae]
MAPYLALSTDSWDRAVELYDWNTSVSAAFFESLHYLEVGLRNALDQAATEHLTPDWLERGPGLLSRRSRHVVSLARGRAGGLGASHGKVIAELPFGFWWSLLADEYNRRLWAPALRHAFAGPVRRRTLHAELDELRRLRNRIAHHEPVHERDLARDDARLLDVAERISPELGHHITRTSRTSHLIRTRPGAR